MDLSEIANIKVMISCTIKNVYVAVPTVSSAACNFSAISFPGNYFGRNSSRVVPGSIGRPFSVLLKNEPSITVTITLSFALPIETEMGFLNVS